MQSDELTSINILSHQYIYTNKCVAVGLKEIIVPLCK